MSLASRFTGKGVLGAFALWLAVAVAVLVLSMHDNLEYVRQVIRAGARGYVLKDAPASELVEAIDAVLAGRPFYSAQLAMRMAEQAVMPTPVEALTPRFESVQEGMEAQTSGAEQISEAVASLNAAALQTKNALEGFQDAATKLNLAVTAVNGGIARFKTDEDAGDVPAPNQPSS